MESNGRIQKAAPVLLRLMHRLQPTAIIETGTYLGTGSTQIFATLFPNVPICTIESNPRHHLEACKNLAHFPHVTCYYGLSVGRAAAIDFIKKDPLLRARIDGIAYEGSNEEESRQFYSNELAYQCQPEHLLKTVMELCGDGPFMVYLDSAGGIGYLEYMYLRRLMGDKPYGLMLDDIKHIKHIRSWENLKNDPRAELLAVDPNDGFGWLCAAVNMK